MTPESRVLSGCLAYLHKSPGLFWRNSTGVLRAGHNRWVSFGLKGSSDIIGVLPGGRFLACEVKAPRGGRLSDEQHQFLAAVRGLGGLALCVHSCAELDEVLRAEGYNAPGPLFHDKENGDFNDEKSREGV
ncbi:MAG: VRR-NUC domain-containing protein [Treponematales bacterium]